MIVGHWAVINAAYGGWKVGEIIRADADGVWVKVLDGGGVALPRPEVYLAHAVRLTTPDRDDARAVLALLKACEQALDADLEQAAERHLARVDAVLTSKGPVSAAA